MTLSKTWRKAQASNASGNCVEVRMENGRVYLRDSKPDGTGVVNWFTTAEWAAFLDGAKGGEFDLPE